MLSQRQCTKASFYPHPCTLGNVRILGQHDLEALYHCTVRIIGKELRPHQAHILWEIMVRLRWTSPLVVDGLPRCKVREAVQPRLPKVRGLALIASAPL